MISYFNDLLVISLSDTNEIGNNLLVVPGGGVTGGVLDGVVVVVEWFTY